MHFRLVCVELQVCVLLKTFWNSAAVWCQADFMRTVGASGCDVTSGRYSFVLTSVLQEFAMVGRLGGLYSEDWSNAFSVSLRGVASLCAAQDFLEFRGRLVSSRFHANSSCATFSRFVFFCTLSLFQISERLLLHISVLA